MNVASATPRRGAVWWRFGDDPAPLRECLAAGGVLAIPTESSYGLAVDPRDPAGVEAIYRLKRRERGRPLPVVIADRSQLADLGADPEAPEVSAVARHWPAPLSIVLPHDPGRLLPAAAGTGTVAVRIPAHGGLRDLLRALGTPLTATSANESGAPAIRTPAALEDLFIGVDAVIVDGGELPGGPPSTLVRWDGDRWTCLRRGAFDPSELDPRGEA